MGQERFREMGAGSFFKVELSFRNNKATASFTLYESLGVQRIGDMGVAPVSIGTGQGELLEDRERKILSLAWSGNGLGFVLVTRLDGQLTKEEVIRVAESTLAIPQATMTDKFFNPAQRTFFLAMEEARRLGHNYTSTARILLDPIGQKKGVSVRVLTHQR